MQYQEVLRRTQQNTHARVLRLNFRRGCWLRAYRLVSARDFGVMISASLIMHMHARYTSKAVIRDLDYISNTICFITTHPRDGEDLVIIVVIFVNERDRLAL